jgi:hypothetical protein
MTTDDIFKTPFGITAFITVIGSLLYVMGMALSQILRHREKQPTYRKYLKINSISNGKRKNVACICPIMIYNEWVKQCSRRRTISGYIMKKKSENKSSTRLVSYLSFGPLKI